MRRKTGSYAVGRERREAILEAALGHFTQSGYYRTSMAEIAADVGITEPGLKHHFPSKKHLLLAVVGRRFAMAGEWADELGADGPLGPIGRLREITRRALERPGMIELFVLMSAEASDPSSAAHDLFVEHYEMVVEAMNHQFQEGVADGRFRPDRDYRAVSEQCVAMSDGLQLQWVLSRGRLDLLDRLGTYLHQLALHVLVSPDAVAPLLDRLHAGNEPIS